MNGLASPGLDLRGGPAIGTPSRTSAMPAIGNEMPTSGSPASDATPSELQTHAGQLFDDWAMHPQLKRIEATDDPLVYLLTLVSVDGTEEQRIAKMSDVAPRANVASGLVDMRENWDGDAESIRSLANAAAKF